MSKVFLNTIMTTVSTVALTTATKITKAVNDVTYLVTTAEANGYIADIATLIFWAIRIYIIVTLVEPLKEWWQGENEGEERQSKGAKRKLIMGVIILAATVMLEVGVKKLLSGEGMPSLFGA